MGWPVKKNLFGKRALKANPKLLTLGLRSTEIKIAYLDQCFGSAFINKDMDPGSHPVPFGSGSRGLIRTRLKQIRANLQIMLWHVCQMFDILKFC